MSILTLLSLTPQTGQPQNNASVKQDTTPNEIIFNTE